MHSVQGNRRGRGRLQPFGEEVGSRSCDVDAGLRWARRYAYRAGPGSINVGTPNGPADETGQDSGAALDVPFRPGGRCSKEGGRAVGLNEGTAEGAGDRTAPRVVAKVVSPSTLDHFSLHQVVEESILRNVPCMMLRGQHPRFPFLALPHHGLHVGPSKAMVEAREKQTSPMGNRTESTQKNQSRLDTTRLCNLVTGPVTKTSAGAQQRPPSAPRRNHGARWGLCTNLASLKTEFGVDLDEVPQVSMRWSPFDKSRADSQRTFVGQPQTSMKRNTVAGWTRERPAAAAAAAAAAVVTKDEIWRFGLPHRKGSVKVSARGGSPSRQAGSRSGRTERRNVTKHHERAHPQRYDGRRLRRARMARSTTIRR
jgi:hypothetical protein